MDMYFKCLELQNNRGIRNKSSFLFHKSHLTSCSRRRKVCFLGIYGDSIYEDMLS